MKDIKECAKELIGLNLEAAKRKLKKNGLLLRVTEIDGREMIGDCAARSNRVNVEVEQGCIVNVSHIG